MARHTAKSHKIRKVEILVIQIVIKLLKECALNGAIVILATHDDRLVNECSKVIDMSRL